MRKHDVGVMEPAAYLWLTGLTAWRKHRTALRWRNFSASVSGLYIPENVTSFGQSKPTRRKASRIQSVKEWRRRGGAEAGADGNCSCSLICVLSLGNRSTSTDGELGDKKINLTLSHTHTLTLRWFSVSLRANVVTQFLRWFSVSVLANTSRFRLHAGSLFLYEQTRHDPDYTLCRQNKLPLAEIFMQQPSNQLTLKLLSKNQFRW